jgi:uncharacterized protein (DUF2141 family)
MSKKVKLTYKESEEILPIIREFNKIAGAMASLLGHQVASKERKISVMVSRIKRPNEQKGQIKVKTVEFSKGFLERQRNKKKGKNQSEWDDQFTEKRGYII